MLHFRVTNKLTNSQNKQGGFLSCYNFLNLWGHLKFTLLFLGRFGIYFVNFKRFQKFLYHQRIYILFDKELIPDWIRSNNI